MSHDRVAIITGSHSGIGKATAVALAERGYDVGPRAAGALGSPDRWEG